MAVSTNVSGLSVINLPGRHLYLSINILFCEYDRVFTVSKGEKKVEKDAKHQAHQVVGTETQLVYHKALRLLILFPLLLGFTLF